MNCKKKGCAVYGGPALKKKNDNNNKKKKSEYKEARRLKLQFLLPVFLSSQYLRVAMVYM